MTKSKFEGYYFKYQNGNNTIAFIPGVSDDKAFIQVITNDKSYYFSYPKSQYQSGTVIRVGNCRFSKSGITIDIQNNCVTIKAKIKYFNLQPLKYDIMGLFKYFPMQCRHGIISMRHNLNGWVSINGQSFNLNNGIGYIEKDSGTSFPKSYIWVQCNDFKEECSVSLSIAEIPFLGSHFTGCICAIYFKGKEYRLTTYCGVRIIKCSRDKIILKQGRHILVVNIFGQDGQKLMAPQCGEMNRVINECASCNARFRFYENLILLFDLKSNGASFEYVS